jgi:hypothetical protein
MLTVLLLLLLLLLLLQNWQVLESSRLAKACCVHCITFSAM